MTSRRRLLTRLLDVAVIDLALNFTIILIAAEPQVEDRRQIRIPVDHYGVAALRARDHVREKGDAVQGQSATPCVHRAATVLSQRKTVVTAERIAQRRAFISDDPDRFADEHLGKRRNARRP